MRNAVIACVVALALAACAGMPTAPPVAVCSDVGGESLIEKYVPDLRLADTMFKLAVLEVGRLDAVKQEDIARVLDEAEALIDHGATYSGLVMYLLPKFRFIRENMGAEIVIVGEYFTAFADVQVPIYAKDVCYLKHHINSQRQKVLPWIR